MKNKGNGVIGGLVGLAALFGIILLFSSFAVVDSGERGVVVRMGKVTGRILEEGFTQKKPFVERVVEMNVKTQLVKVEAGAASKDLQDVDLLVALNYRLDAAKVDNIYQQVRKDYKTVWIMPALLESIKAVAAEYTAEEIVTKRNEASLKMSAAVSKKLEERGIIVEAFSLTNIQYSASFTKAIEAKVTAEQDALAAENKLAQVEFEAQQRSAAAKGVADALLIQAEAKAKAIEIETEALKRGGNEIIELRAIERWDGVLPTITSGATPFVNIK